MRRAGRRSRISKRACLKARGQSTERGWLCPLGATAAVVAQALLRRVLAAAADQWAQQLGAALHENNFRRGLDALLALRAHARECREERRQNALAAAADAFRWARL